MKYNEKYKKIRQEKKKKELECNSINKDENEKIESETENPSAEGCENSISVKDNTNNKI